MTSEPATANDTVVRLTINRVELVAPVLERLVSAGAARADLTVDRLVNALTAIDALLDSANSVLDDAPLRSISMTIAPGEIRLSLDGLKADESERIVEAARLPDLGDVLGRLASSVDVTRDGNTSSLSILLT